MKKITFKLLLLGSFILIKCSMDPIFEFNDLVNVNITKDSVFERIYYSESQEKDNYAVTKNDAVLLAQNYFTMESKFNGKLQKLKKIYNIKELIDSTSKETLIYVIEYEKGFCLVSGDSRFDPILAYSDENEWGGESVEGPNIFIDIYIQEIKKIKIKNEKQSDELKGIWKRLSTATLSNYEPTDIKPEVIPPGCIYGDCRPTYCDYYYFVTVGPFVNAIAKWSQLGSFNYYCPSNSGCDCNRSPAGCGPVALAMLMRYHKYPLMNMQFNDDFAYTDYENMPLYRGPCSNNSGGYKSSAMLVRLCGAAMNSIYGVLGTCNTATLIGNIGNGLEFFGYTHSGKGDLSARYNAINNDLKKLYPVILSGAKNAVGSKWHIWLADGYRELTTETWYDNGTCVDPYMGSNPYECGVCPDCVTCFTYYKKEWHMNWGWNGSSNGWYLASHYSIGEYDNLMKAYTNIRHN